MAQPTAEPPNKDPLAERVAARRARQQHPNGQGIQAFFRGLGIAGGLGWLIVIPTLAGLALGRWLDHRLGSGITATGALLAVGLAFGCRLAWKRMHHP